MKIQTFTPHVPYVVFAVATAEIDVGTKRVKRHAAFAIPLDARNLGAAETAAAIDPNALCAKTHGGLHGALHGAAEGYATLELLCDVLCNQGRVDFRLTDFDDVQRHLGLGHLRQVLAQNLDVLTLLADDNAGTGGINS